MPHGRLSKALKKNKKKKLTKAKAGKILRDDEVRGKKLTGKQKKFFGFVRGGGTPTRT